MKIQKESAALGSNRRESSHLIKDTNAFSISRDSKVYITYLINESSLVLISTRHFFVTKFCINKQKHCI